MLPYLITDEINLALVWTSVARAAYTKGKLTNAAEAKAKAQSAYFNATELLSEVKIDHRAGPLLIELAGLAAKLDQLAALAARIEKPGPEGW
jgi:hypothetical protein